MEISVIIPTYNRASKIASTLAALRQQTKRDFEVIVVVDGSTDNTLEVLERFRNDFGSMKIIPVPNGGRAKARNVGVQTASGRYLIFIDDDIRLFENALALHYEFHLRHPGCIAFGQLEIDPRLNSSSDFLKYRRSIESGWSRGLDEQITFTNYGITSANLSLPRNIFDQLRGFDQELRDSEDFDFSIRALQINIPVRYVSAIRGYHDDDVSLLQYVERQKEYIKSKYLLLKKRPEYRELLPGQFLWMEKLPGDRWKKWIFGSEEWWIPMFSNFLFSWLPAAIRYRFYSSFIYVQSVLLIRRTTK